MSSINQYDTITQEAMESVFGGAKGDKVVVRKEAVAGSTRSVYKVRGRGNMLFITVQGNEMRYVEAKKADKKAAETTKKPVDMAKMNAKADAIVDKLKQDTIKKVRAKRAKADAIVDKFKQDTIKKVRAKRAEADKAKAAAAPAKKAPAKKAPVKKTAAKKTAAKKTATKNQL
jgi:hypothetical protein